MRPSRGNGLRMITVGVLFAALWLWAAPPAVAAITVTVTSGGLVVTGDGENDTIGIRCQGGDVSVSGMEPSTGAAPCSSIVSIQVTAGGGADRVDLSRVTAEEFTTLTSIAVSAGGGDDRVDGGPLGETLGGDAGNDRIGPGGGVDALEGGKGSDALSLRADGEVVLTDTDLTHTGGSATLAGFESAEIRNANSAAAVSFDAAKFSGPVSLTGGGLDDTLIGGRGDDRISGADGNDTMRGGPGADLLSPGTGTSEVLDGGKGADTLALQGDGDFTVTDSSISGLVGGSVARIESLTASGGAGNNRLDAAGFSGVALLRGDAGNDVLVGGVGDDSINGGDGNDRLTGGSGNDRVSGDEGDDLLRGGQGDDDLNGGAGKDRCLGGPGTNRLTSC
jgi:Ca2+-binding RTX toxin-like protein